MATIEDLMQGADMAAVVQGRVAPGTYTSGQLPGLKDGDTLTVADPKAGTQVTALPDVQPDRDMGDIHFDNNGNARVGGTELEKIAAEYNFQQARQRGENIVPHLQQMQKLGMFEGHTLPSQSPQDATADFIPTPKMTMGDTGQQVDYATWQRLRRDWQINNPDQPLPPALRQFMPGVAEVNMAPFAPADNPLSHELQNDPAMQAEAKAKWFARNPTAGQNVTTQGPASEGDNYRLDNPDDTSTTRGPALPEILQGTLDQRTRAAKTATALQIKSAMGPAWQGLDDDTVIALHDQAVKQKEQSSVVATIRATMPPAGNAHISDQEILHATQKYPALMYGSMFKALLPDMAQIAMDRQTRRQMIGGPLADDTPERVQQDKSVITANIAQSAGQQVNQRLFPGAPSLGDFMAIINSANLGFPSVLARHLSNDADDPTNQVWDAMTQSYHLQHPYLQSIDNFIGYLIPGSPASYLGRVLNPAVGGPVSRMVMARVGSRLTQLPATLLSRAAGGAAEMPLYGAISTAIESEGDMPKALAHLNPGAPEFWQDVGAGVGFAALGVGFNYFFGSRPSGAELLSESASPQARQSMERLQKAWDLQNRQGVTAEEALRKAGVTAEDLATGFKVRTAYARRVMSRVIRSAPLNDVGTPTAADAEAAQTDNAGATPGTPGEGAATSSENAQAAKSEVPDGRVQTSSTDEAAQPAKSSAAIDTSTPKGPNGEEWGTYIQRHAAESPWAPERNPSPAEASGTPKPQPPAESKNGAGADSGLQGQGDKFHVEHALEVLQDMRANAIGPRRAALENAIQDVKTKLASGQTPLAAQKSTLSADEQPSPINSREPGESAPRPTPPAVLPDAHAVGLWYADTFHDAGGSGAIEALASMSPGRFVLADVPPHVVDAANVMEGDKDQSKVDRLAALDPSHRAALPPAIFVGDPSGKGLYAADGSHRLQAAQKAGDATIQAYVPESYVGKHGITQAVWPGMVQKHGLEGALEKITGRKITGVEPVEQGTLGGGNNGGSEEPTSLNTAGERGTTSEQPEPGNTATAGRGGNEPASEVAQLPGETVGPAGDGTVGTGREAGVEEGAPAALQAHGEPGDVESGGSGGGGSGEGTLQPTGEQGRRPSSGRRTGKGAAPDATTAATPGSLPEGLGTTKPSKRVPKVAPGAGPAEGVAPALASNFTITDPSKLEAGGKTKFKQNVAAVELARKIIADGRPATSSEQEVLALFSGWGQFPGAFNSYTPGEDWKEEAKLMKELLTPEEWEAARRSTLNAHYTSPQVAVSMWKAAQQLGFTTPGRVLEPSVGAGIFFGLMPLDLREGSRLTAVELDPMTASIAKLLYPRANVQNKGFEKLAVPDGFFDLAIGNWPFGDFKVNDRQYNRYVAPIHDYFFLKTLDKVRPGGLVMGITSTGTLDKARGNVRAAIAERGDLVAAFRLPDGAFGKSAGTAVVTDLLIFRRREPGQPQAGAKWAEIKTVPDPDGGEPIPINEYFVEHPEHVLGTVDRKSRLYGSGQPHVSATPDFEQRLARAIESLPSGVYRETVRKVEEQETELVKSEAKTGAYVLQDGKLMQNNAGALEPTELDAKTTALVTDHVKVRDALRKLIEAQLADAGAGDIDKARSRLNGEYERFVKKNGPLTKRSNVKAFADDPDSPVVLALEHVDAKGNVSKADIFTKNTIRAGGRAAKASTPGEALGVSLNETARVDIGRIAELLGVSEKESANKLLEGKLAFRDPAGGWKSAEQYLSGNVKRRLAEATEAAAADPSYAPNVPALQEVQPKDVMHDEIDVHLGSAWVPPADIQRFMAELYALDATPEHFNIRYLGQTGEWLAEYSPMGARRWDGRPQDVELWGTDRVDAMKVLEHALNNRVILVRDKVSKDKSVVNPEATAAANAKVEDMQTRFKDWVWEDDSRRERLHRFYNDNFNNLAPVSYNGSHLSFPGMNPAISLRAHQTNAVWETIVNGTALYAHEVGTGKTYTMVAAAMELKRLGLARKPAIAALDSNVETIIQQAKALYPAARIFYVGQGFDAARRKATVSKIATGDWDVVILTHDNLNMLPMRPDVEADFIRKEMAELEAAIMEASESQSGKSDNRMVKRLEKALAKLEERLERALDARKDNAITFEETGIDQLFVDEAHKYKSLPVYTKLAEVKGVPNGRSDRATAMWMRTQWLQQMNAGRGVVFATGTPVTNTMAELYTMQRYLQMPELVERGVASFDAWASTFGRIITKMEYKVTGDYAPVSRFAAFVNLPELQQISRQVIDVQRAEDMPGFQRPKRVDHVVALPMSPEQKAYLNVIKQRAEAARQNARKMEKGADNMVAISGDARKSALDHRLIDQRTLPNPDDKINAITRNVVKLLKDHPGTTQMIFSDLGINPSKHSGDWSFYKGLIDALVEAGIPRDKIINFGDLKDSEKPFAAERLRKADAIIGIGGSEKLGTGVNAQDHVIALHHADVPWIPAYLEQRDGRGWRQGNQNEKVHIYRYVTEGSFDTFMWQIVDNKTRFIGQFMTGKKVARAVNESDGEELTPAQVMAIASGNPLLLEKVQLDRDVKDLEAGRTRHLRAEIRAKDEMRRLRQSIDSTEAAAKRFNDVATWAREHAAPEFAMELGGKVYSSRAEAQEALDTLVSKLPRTNVGVGDWTPLGTYNGWELSGKNTSFGVNIKVESPMGSDTATPSIASIEHYTRAGTWEAAADKKRFEAKRLQTDLATTQGQLGKPFGKLQELELKRGKLEDITRQLSEQGKKPAEETAVTAGGEDSEGDERGPDEGVEHSRAPAPGHVMAAPNPPPNPSAVAGTGAVAGTNLVPIELPELVDIARELLGGKWPFVNTRLRSAMGQSKYKGTDASISVHRDMGKDPAALARVLAHEIGHLADWIPDANMKRGNILGRVGKLSAFLRHHLTGAVGSSPELRKELIALSEWWHPYDVAKESASYRKYRESARELFAEAISVLLNAPAEVEARAPKFYTSLMNLFDRHPDFKREYLTALDVMNGTTPEIAEKRRADVREAFKTGEDVMRAVAAERENSRFSAMDYFIQQSWDRNRPIQKLQNAVEAKGVKLPDTENPKYAMAELAYADNRNHLMLGDIDRRVSSKLEAADMDWNVLGEYMLFDRIASGDRSTFANPFGHTKDTAAKMLVDLEDQLGPDRWKVLKRAAKIMHAIAWQVTEEARDAGIYAADKIAELEPNKEHYAPFAVIEHLQDYIGAGLYKQIGTFKPVANPARSLVMKLATINRLIEQQKAKRVVIDHLTQHFPDDIEKAPAKIGPGGMRMDPGAPPTGREWLAIMEKGKLEHYAVDPYIERMFYSEAAGPVVKLLHGLMYKVFHPLYVTYNVAWAAGLLNSDLWRTWRLNALKGNPVTLRDILRGYWQAIPPAFRRARGIRDSQIEQMLQDKALDAPAGDYNLSGEEDSLERLMKRYGLGEQRRDQAAIVKAVQATLSAVEGVGHFVISVPKIAMWNVLAEKGIDGHELSYRVRNFAGHPDRRQRGRNSMLVNSIFAYHNAVARFLRSDYEAGFKDPKTKSGYWFRFLLRNALPKALMAAAAAGLFGGTAALMMKNISEFEKSTKTVIPLGLYRGADGKERTAYLRFRDDPMMTLLGGVLWKLLDAHSSGKGAGRQVQDMIAGIYGDLPHLAPAIESMLNWGQYAAGANPYDSFRRRNIITDQDFKAGGWYSFRDMLSWQLDQAGVLSILAHPLINKLEDKPEREATVEATIRGIPGLNRFFAVSDQGMREEEAAAELEQDAERARFRLELPNDVRRLTSERFRLEVKKDRVTDAERARRAELNAWYGKVYLPLTKAQWDAQQRGDQQLEVKIRDTLERASQALLK